MNTTVIVMLANMAIEIAYIICVTLAAMHFDKPSLLWWYVLALFMGYTLKTRTKDKDNDNGANEN